MIGIVVVVVGGGCCVWKKLKCANRLRERRQKGLRKRLANIEMVRARLRRAGKRRVEETRRVNIEEMDLSEENGSDKSVSVADIIVHVDGEDENKSNGHSECSDGKTNDNKDETEQHDEIKEGAKGFDKSRLEDELVKAFNKSPKRPPPPMKLRSQQI